jgi:hypothetical protein
MSEFVPQFHIPVFPQTLLDCTNNAPQPTWDRLLLDELLTSITVGGKAEDALFSFPVSVQDVDMILPLRSPYLLRCRHAEASPPLSASEEEFAPLVTAAADELLPGFQDDLKTLFEQFVLKSSKEANGIAARCLKLTTRINKFNGTGKVPLVHRYKQLPQLSGGHKFSNDATKNKLLDIRATQERVSYGLVLGYEKTVLASRFFELFALHEDLATELNNAVKIRLNVSKQLHAEQPAIFREVKQFADPNDAIKLISSIAATWLWKLHAKVVSEYCMLFTNRSKLELAKVEAVNTADELIVAKQVEITLDRISKRIDNVERDVRQIRSSMENSLLIQQDFLTRRLRRIHMAESEKDDAAVVDASAV